MRFKLRQMEVFRAVMLTGTVSGAARLLHVSQPAVSKLLAHTETNLGLTLFHRTGGRLIPTKIAKQLLEEVHSVYDAALKVDDFVENARKAPSGKVNIICSPSLGLQVVPRLISEFLHTHPEVTIQFHTTLIQDMPNELLSGKADVAISVLPVEVEHLKSEKLIEGKMVCVIPTGHPLANQESISIFDLQAEKLVLYSRTIPFGRLLYAAFEKYQCAINTFIEIPRAELACALVRQGAGIAIIDQFSVEEQLWRGIVVKPLEQDIPIRVSLVMSAYSKPDTAVEKFVQLVRNRLPPQV